MRKIGTIVGPMWAKELLSKMCQGLPMIDDEWSNGAQLIAFSHYFNAFIVIITICKTLLY